MWIQKSVTEYTCTLWCSVLPLVDDFQTLDFYYLFIYLYVTTFCNQKSDSSDLFSERFEWFLSQIRYPSSLEWSFRSNLSQIFPNFSEKLSYLDMLSHWQFLYFVLNMRLLYHRCSNSDSDIIDMTWGGFLFYLVVILFFISHLYQSL